MTNSPVPKQATNLTTGASVQALIPTDIEQAFRFAAAIAQSGMAPKSYGSGNNLPQAVFTAMQLGAEVGLPPMSAVQNIAVINGKPGLYGDAQLALVRSSGLLVHFKEEYAGNPYDDDFCARCTVQRQDQDEPDIHEFSVSDAKIAGLWKKQGPWTQYPKRMLRFRARAFALRDNFGDVLLGLGSSVEELRDHSGPENAKDITPRPARNDFNFEAGTTSFELVDQYGESRGFSDIKLYAAAFVNEINKAGNAEAAQGVWESNQGYIEDIPSNLLDEISQALIEATAETLNPEIDDVSSDAEAVDDDGVIQDEQTADYEPPAIGVPAGEKGPDWEGFADAFIEAVKAAPSVEAIKEIAAVNKAAKDNCFKQHQPAFKRIYEAMKELGAAQ